MKKKAAWSLVILAAGFLCGAMISHEVRLHSAPAQWAHDRSNGDTSRPPSRDQLPTMTSSLFSGLLAVRSQLSTYEFQHGTYPSATTSEEWKRQLAAGIEVEGQWRRGSGPDRSGFPTNPFNGSSRVLIDVDPKGTPGTRQTHGPNACGWYFNAATRHFATNDSIEHGWL